MIRTRRSLGFALLTIVAGVVGWFASFELLNERIKTLIDPTYTPMCDFSVLVSCGPNMASAQGSTFGFPNPILGVTMFVAPLVVGVSILAGAQFAHWFWRLYLLGVTFAISFVIWLISTSVYVLGTLCPWCMVVWVVTIPLFWYTLLYTAKEGHLWLPEGARKKAETLYSWSWVLVLASYLTVAVIAQVTLDWVTELIRAF
ncbi:vitamin K epoxide reductase family protein [Lysinibacter sp. HNR]|uniref:vitamin K epoxide reductase family protein n=1 Tax=Lysinibacter sp. HNR TaxID=3031408 RepID=UPI0024355A13|nr:vitamin K epoxide reductase family protein [Lysinibacter sp. HNR]WGD36273.1 vitamin K epoxide reductase family protein [Lysinibacter sp. HNR]